MLGKIPVLLKKHFWSVKIGLFELLSAPTIKHLFQEIKKLPDQILY